ncbi:MAG TPA: EamA family transporter [Candidatus Eremiobacteraceae bacterium]|nr:EamA family transporter [Candidatus Eremiobacteraceae bacterium]
MAKPAASEVMIWTSLVIVYVVWGSTYLAIRIAVDTMPPLVMVGVRFLIAGGLLFGFRRVALGNEAQPLTLNHWRAAAIVGAGLMLGGNGGVALAERSIPSGITALIAATVPLWIALFDRIWFRRALPPLRIAGLVIGFCAVALLIGRPDASGLNIFGASVAVVAALSWAAGSLYARGAPLPTDALMAVGMEMLAGGALVVIAGVLAGELRDPLLLHPSATSWWAFGYLVVFGALVGFSAYLWLLRVAPISRVSTYAYVNPLVAVGLGWFVLHEQVGASTLAAGAAILAAVALIVWEPTTQPKPAAPDRPLARGEGPPSD